MQLKKFDIIAIKNREDWISRLVRLGTKSIYTHVAMVLDDYHVIDTDLLRPVGIHHFDYKLGEFDCYRLIVPLTKEQEDLVIKFMQKTLNTSYDMFEALAYVFKYLGMYGSEDRYVCISLLTNALKTVGIEISNDFNEFVKSNLIFKVND